MTTSISIHGVEPESVKAVIRTIDAGLPTEFVILEIHAHHDDSRTALQLFINEGDTAQIIEALTKTLSNPQISNY